jgi:hypothetical protein
MTGRNHDRYKYEAFENVVIPLSRYFLNVKSLQRVHSNVMHSACSAHLLGDLNPFKSEKTTLSVLISSRTKGVD